MLHIFFLIFIYVFTPFLTVLSFLRADGEWTPEASLAICELTQYKTLQAQIISYSDAGLPEIHLYSYLAPNVSFFLHNPKQFLIQSSSLTTSNPQQFPYLFYPEYRIH